MLRTSFGWLGPAVCSMAPSCGDTPTRSSPRCGALEVGSDPGLPPRRSISTRHGSRRVEQPQGSERPLGPTCLSATPKVFDGLAVEGTFRSHQVPLLVDAEHPEHVEQLERWMKSYRPAELFDADGRLMAELAEMAPTGARRMGANPHANGGLLLRDLRLPDFHVHAVDAQRPVPSRVRTRWFSGAICVMSWCSERRVPTLPHRTGWRVLAPTVVAVLDAVVAQRFARYPELTGQLVARALDRSRNLAVIMAIVHQPRVDVRRHMLFWHLADRWRRVRSDGTLVPLRLTHQVLADLPAARLQPSPALRARPTLEGAFGRRMLIERRRHSASCSQGLRRPNRREPQPRKVRCAAPWALPDSRGSIRPQRSRLSLPARGTTIRPADQTGAATREPQQQPLCNPHEPVALV